MPSLDSPVHVHQLNLGYCLPACVQMALTQLGIEKSQEQLAQTLGTRPGIGTPFSRLNRLDVRNVDIQLTEWGTIDALIAALDAETAVIAAVTTTPGLPGWQDIRTQHTVLILNISPDIISYHDPALTHGPVSAPRNEFHLAWSYMSEKAAFLRLT